MNTRALYMIFGGLIITLLVLTLFAKIIQRNRNSQTNATLPVPESNLLSQPETVTEDPVTAEVAKPEVVAKQPAEIQDVNAQPSADDASGISTGTKTPVSPAAPQNADGDGISQTNVRGAATKAKTEAGVATTAGTTKSKTDSDYEGIKVL